ncbi:serine/threonine phosphatase [Chamaesiphon sp. VAR_48_metabat_135_sub]|uniref:serine/threonine phosphatase n=1 Tax=Chamaesiphon sp. VAR_48_metabat_135_sub TaxID=2964699 RepID=UPI00286CE83E|nr:serine/threonine phosphatase [Chamaesiphon sp. VAR_48_metabat_135_sub]
MLTCPNCQSVNPQHHNFCQGCGRSLKHHICKSCGSEVEFDAQNCPQCETISGSYWWAIIEPTVAEKTADLNSISASVMSANELELLKLDRQTPTNSDREKSQRSTGLNSSMSGNLQLELETDLWDLIDLVPTPSVATVLDNFFSLAEPLLSQIATSDDLETSPWDLSQPLEPVPLYGESQDFRSLTPIDDNELAQRNYDEATNNQPLVATIYLDPQDRYKLLDPVVIQLLKPSDSSQIRVIDRQPFCNTRLEILMEQQPVILDSNTADSVPLGIGTTATEEMPPADRHRQWQFWNSHGIPKVSQAYIALQVSLPGTIPTIHDSWSDDGKTVTIVEDRSHWTQLLDRWNDPQIPSSQVIYWLDYTLKLWVALEPWQMRQSLLEVANLLLDEDARICFQRLYPEPVDRQLQLTDLAQMWKSLFDRSHRPEVMPIQTATPLSNVAISSSETESDRSYSSSLANLLQSMHIGEVVRVEEVRSKLQQIAYELEPKQLSAPLPSASSNELSIAHDAPTMALERKLIDLQEAAATHVGRKREHNEDCFGIVSRIDRQESPKGASVSARGLYILCDGMGGHAGGEIASSMTVDSLRDYFATRWGDTLPDEQTIREGIVAANEEVFQINQKNSAHGSNRMGTTLVLVLIQDRDIAIAHVGDSRCYGITPTQGLIQITLDHEVGQQQILRGVDPDIAYGRPDSYQLTQAIGPRDRNYIAPEIRFFELQEDTLIVLASDGLTDNQLLENYWLTNVAPLLAPNSNLQNGVDRLIDFANEYNGHDNITALVVRAKLG